MIASPYFDQLETLDPDERETDLFARLPGFVARLKSGLPAWATLLRDVAAETLTNRIALATVPILRKSDLTRLQVEHPPLGGLSQAAAARLFMSPGPIFEPQAIHPDPWSLSRALYAAGFRRGDLLHNCFSYHMTPGGFIFDEAARAMGMSVFPAGVGSTEMQVDAIAHLKPAGYSGTPDYLKIILDKAAELGRDVSSLKKALVSGGALFPSLREEYRQRGIAVLQAYATADLGCIAYESSAMDGMIVNEGIIVEIVRPGTGDPVPDGEVGEVAVTTFNETYPLIRFATGDLSAFMAGPSPCGRTNRRIKGWMGRADQTTKIKGMFVHPSQIAEIGKQHSELGRLRLVVTRAAEQDMMTLLAEVRAPDDGLKARVGETLGTATKLKGLVEFVPWATLANDGKVIADERKYD